MPAEFMVGLVLAALVSFGVGAAGAYFFTRDARDRRADRGRHENALDPEGTVVATGLRRALPADAEGTVLVGGRHRPLPVDPDATVLSIGPDYGPPVDEDATVLGTQVQELEPGLPPAPPPLPGARMRFAVVVVQRPGGEVRLLNSSMVLRIGRERGAGTRLVLDEPFVSGRHAIIRFEIDRFVLYDQGSVNHTYAAHEGRQEVRVQGPWTLRSRDVIRLGGPPPATPEPGPGPSSSRRPPAGETVYLVFVEENRVASSVS
jgi:hypothetical protein